MMRYLLVAGMLMMSNLAHSAMPHPYTATYEVSRNGSALGTATVVFKSLSNGQYEFSSRTVGDKGLAALAGVANDERSVLRWNGQQPETVSYSLQQKMAWKSRERSMHVDAANRSISIRDKDKKFSPPYQPGVLDRNAVIVAVMRDLANGKSGDLKYLVPNRNEIDTHVYRTAPPERLATALGEQNVVRVERIRESANGRSTTLWLGQDRNFVPLRVQQKEPKGDVLDMRIISIR